MLRGHRLPWCSVVAAPFPAPQLRRWQRHLGAKDHLGRRTRWTFILAFGELLLAYLMPLCSVPVVPAAPGAVVHQGAHPAPKGARPGKARAFLRLPAPSRLGPLCTIYLREETGPFMYFSAYLYLSLSVFSVCAGRGGSVRRGD